MASTMNTARPMSLSGREKAAILQSFSRVASTMVGKRVPVVEIKGDDLGYTSDDNIIHINLSHEYMSGLSKEQAFVMNRGIFSHELLHLLITNFKEYNASIDRRPRMERKIFRNFLNICEDGAIEYFASGYLSNDYVKSIEYSRSVIYNHASILHETDNAFNQFGCAILHFRFFGFCKGHFTCPDAEDAFKKSVPWLSRAFEDPTQMGRIKCAEEILDISRPLWEEQAKANEEALKQLEEMLNSLRKAMGSAMNNGSGTGTDSSEQPSGPESGLTKRRNITFRRVSPEEYEKAKKEAEPQNGPLPDGDLEVLIPDEPEDEEKNSSNSGSDSDSEAGVPSPSDAKPDDGADNPKSGNGSDGSEPEEGSGDSESDKDSGGSKANKKSGGLKSGKESGDSESNGKSDGESDEKPDDLPSNGGIGDAMANGSAEDESDDSTEDKSGGSGKEETDSPEETDENSSGGASRGGSRTEDSESEDFEDGGSGDGDDTSSDKSSSPPDKPAGAHKGNAGKSDDDTDDAPESSNNESKNKKSTGTHRPTPSTARNLRPGESDSGNDTSGDDSNSPDFPQNSSAGSDPADTTDTSDMESEMEKELVLSDEDLDALSEVCNAYVDISAEDNKARENEDEIEFDLKVNGGLNGICKRARCQNVWVQCDATPKAQQVYDRIVAPMRADIDHLVSQLKRLFKNRAEEKMYKQSGKISVKRLNCGRATSRVFTKRRYPDTSDLAVCIAIDNSGSMFGDKINMARKAAIGLAEVFGKLDIPIYMFGFTADKDGFDANHFHYLNWSNRPKDRLRLLSIESKSNNFDGYAIRYATELLKRKDAEKKLLIVISDGLPSCGMYTRNRVDGISDVRAAVNEANRVATTIGILIGSKESAVHRMMYGYNFFLCPNTSTLFTQLGALLKKYA